MPVVITNIKRVSQPLAEELGALGVATVHEAQGRKGLLAANLRPIFRPILASGSAVTCEVAPGDNWMIHVAIEQCQPGDMLVVTPTSPSNSGFFGDLLATLMRSRGVQGLVIDAGVRDIATLTEMQFPVWSSAVFAQGTVKEDIANVNTPITCGGALIHPGDLIIADDDGVVVVKRQEAEDVLESAKARVVEEEIKRQRFENGELSLDVYDMRDRLAEAGLRYMDAEDES